MVRNAFPALAVLILAACSGGDGAGGSDGATSVASPQIPGPVAASPDDPAKPGGAELPPMDHRVSSPDTPVALPSSDKNDGSPQTAMTVPERFRGLYALDRKACEGDHNYNPTFQNVEVKAHEVRFFETGGSVTHVRASGDRAAITLQENRGDREAALAIFLALNGDGTARYRSVQGPVLTMIRCDAPDPR
tara:strand:- start:990 stop:1562 length:573 start_codon:yes stop_codon:yes gene_type:complete